MIFHNVLIETLIYRWISHEHVFCLMIFPDFTTFFHSKLQILMISPVSKTLPPLEFHPRTSISWAGAANWNSVTDSGTSRTSTALSRSAIFEMVRWYRIQYIYTYITIVVDMVYISSINYQLSYITDSWFSYGYSYYSYIIKQQDE